MLCFPGIISFNEVTVEGDLTVDIINSVTMHPSNLWKIVSGVPSGVEMNITDYDTIEIGGQLKVGRINGIMWDDIVQRIVWRDLSDHIEGNTTINGVRTCLKIFFLFILFASISSWISFSLNVLVGAVSARNRHVAVEWLGFS